jgi:hypothetical protein
LQNRLSGIDVSPARVAVAPVTVVAYKLDAFQNRTNQPDWEAQMAAGIVPETSKLVSAGGGRIIRSEDVKSYSDLFDSFHAWGTISAMEIAAQMYGRTNYGIKSIGGWRFRKNLMPIRETIDADFVMFMAFREGFETGGRVLASMFAGMHTYWKQVGVVCLADLRDGRMVWCILGADRWMDLRLPDSGQHAVQELLRPILGASLISKYGTPRPEPIRPPTDR